MEKEDSFQTFRPPLEGGGVQEGKSEPLRPEGELKGLLQSLYSHHDKLQRELELFYEKVGRSPQEVSLFLENPENLSEPQRRVYQDKKRQLKGLSSAPEKGKKSAPKRESDSQESKKRKGKTLGSRKGWISM